jgi:NhaP-type Na+/H+ or K+/H+ antiporter
VLRLARQPDASRLVWIAPRGLITVLLFLTAATTPGLGEFPFGAIMLVVLATAALTAFAHHGHAPVAVEAGAAQDAAGEPRAAVEETAA